MTHNKSVFSEKLGKTGFNPIKEEAAEEKSELVIGKHRSMGINKEHLLQNNYVKERTEEHDVVDTPDKVREFTARQSSPESAAKKPFEDAPTKGVDVTPSFMGKGANMVYKVESEGDLVSVNFEEKEAEAAKMKLRES